MAVGATLAAALTDASPRRASLYLGGLDVTLQPGSPGNRYGVPIDSIRIVERGPEEVSELSCEIEDPVAAGVWVPVPDGTEVLLYDHAAGAVLFAGFVDRWTPDPTPGGQGRTIGIQAIGIEALLDWPIIEPVNPIGSDLNPEDFGEAISWLISNYAPTYRLYAPDPDASDGSNNGSFTWPMGRLDTTLSNRIGEFGSLGPIPLRQAIRRILEETCNGGTPPFCTRAFGGAQVTVDWRRGLRVFREDGRPDDWSDLVVSDIPASSLRAANLRYTASPGNVVRAVYIVGANAAGSGWVTDGTGIVGRQATISDDTSDTTARRDQIASRYLAEQARDISGTLTLEDWSAADPTIHPSCTVTITDPAINLSAQAFTIREIAKTFSAGGTLQTWQIRFGSRRPSLARSLRRMSSSLQDTTTPSGSGGRAQRRGLLDLGT